MGGLFFICVSQHLELFTGFLRWVALRRATICTNLHWMRRSSHAWRQVNLPSFVRRIAACSSRKDRHAAKYNITKSVRWLGKISSKCVYFIDNPFKVVVFGIIFHHLSSYLFEIKRCSCSILTFVIFCL